MNRIYTNFQQYTSKMELFRSIETEIDLNLVNLLVTSRPQVVFSLLKPIENATQSGHLSSIAPFFVSIYCHLP